MKKEVLIGALIISFSLFLFTLIGVFAQKGTEFELLTKPYLRFEAETEISAPLNFSTKEGFKGKLEIGGLTGNRTYTLPDLSGEICLNAGNCVISPRGIENRLAKFTARGLDNSSIEDLAKEISIFINENGDLGVGLNPDFKLHVGGKIQARDDICTDLKGGICLSQFEKPKSLEGVVIEGAGSPERVPLWKKDYQLGDSVIYQENENIGIGMIPAYKLDVAGTIRILGFRLPVSPHEGYGLISDDKGFGTWQPVLQPEAKGGDIAERFFMDPNCDLKKECPEIGDLVSINQNGFIEKSRIAYDKNLVGVVSENPTLTMKGETERNVSLPVALIGKVKTKVSLLNGEVEIGDPLTSSKLPGVAQKATKFGKIIGFALESLNEKDFENCSKSKKIFDCERKIGKINVLINLQINPGK